MTEYTPTSIVHPAPANVPSSGGGSLSGTGSPEGVETADVGQFYSDMTDPNAPIIWQKTTGAGTNTGWVQIIR